ncbi:MAG: PKD domain-containing protein, partial [Bacteroidia bacterium]
MKNIIKQPILNPFQRKGLALFVIIILFSLPFGKGWGWAAQAQVSASFSATPVRGCAPLVVSFTDQSTGGPTSYTWNLGNGVNAYTNAPATSYTLSGIYSVTLTVSNGTSTSSTVQTNYITVYANPTAGFTLSTDTACVGQPVKFTDATIIGSGGAAISSWAWDFGDGNAQTVTTTTVSHNYSTTGSYPVSLIVTDLNGCTSTKTETVVVVSIPTPSFSATPTFSCSAPLSVTFTNTSTSAGATTYSWHFGDGSTSISKNPTHTYTVSGIYNVTLILNQHGCIDSIVIPNMVTLQNMNASFAAIPSVVCTGHPITFTNTSTPAATIAHWVFGDGGTSNNISPTYTYNTSGTYSVSLSATDAQGCKDSTTRVVTVNQSPSVAFTADTIACSVPFAVTFTNNSTGASTYQWVFGDGNTSVSTNPMNTYTVSGTYTVSLIATNNAGTCSDTLVKNHFITISPPMASFTTIPDSGCVPLTVNFTSNSTSTLDPITSYTWTYGNGSSNTTAAPTNFANTTYTASGVYSPTLTIQTSTGCTNTFVCVNCIKAGTLPVASFTLSPDSVCYGLPVNFTSTSAGATGWNWIFGDGGTSNQPAPVHVYGDTGTFQIKLVIYNHGCVDTSLITPVVVLAPKAQFTYSLSCINYFTVHFTSTSEGADSLVWAFGDGTFNTSNTTSPVHTYPSIGPITCTLTAYSYKAHHCINSITQSFTIAKPIAHFTVNDSNGCYPFAPTFISTTSQCANSCLWNFGDYTTPEIELTHLDSVLDSMEVIPSTSYTYNHPGKYIVKLIITDINGCKDSITKAVVTMGPIPYFRSTPLKGCAPLLVLFKDSIIDDSTVVQWHWDFGDPSSGVNNTSNAHFPPNIPHIYNASGVYDVTLTVTDKNGCKDSLVKSNYIQVTYPLPHFTNPQFSCKGNVLTFDATTTNAVGPSYQWNFGDGTTTPYSYNPIITHSFTKDSLYAVILTVKDTNGCPNTFRDTVLILKPKAKFGWIIDSTGCSKMEVTFKDSSSGFANGWLWNFGDGATSTLSDPTHTYTRPGSYNVTLFVTNAGGCTDTLIRNGIIVVPGPIGTFSFSPVTGCNPLTVTFIGQSSNTINYTWDFADGTVIVNGDSIVHTYTMPGTYNPVLILTNLTSTGALCKVPYTGGVVTSVSGVNVILSPSVITLVQDSSGNVSSTASGGVAPYTYSWTPPSTNISCANCANIVVTGTGDTVSYILTATASNGCNGMAT